MPRGRPTIYNRKTVDKILERLAGGESLRAICSTPGMPAERTVREWAIDDVDGFHARYTRAREIQAHGMADDIIEIADTPVLGKKLKTTGRGRTRQVETVEGDMIEHRRLQVDSRKWYLSKVLPKVYGNKLALGGDEDGSPMTVIVRKLTEAAE